MKRAVILHGMPSVENYQNPESESQSNSHWIPWLQQQLCSRGILAQSPEMPRPYEPDYEAWKNEFESQHIDEETILVGHSCGAGFLTRWLCETEVLISKLVLVAPWLDRENNYGELFDFELSSNLTSKTVHGIDVLYSTNDNFPMQSTLKFLQSELADARFHKFINYGHFCLKHMNTREFPELLDVCLNENN